MQGFELGRFRLKPNASEADLLAAARRMDERHLTHQAGFRRHLLVALADGQYLDIAIADTQEAAERLCASWAGQPDCEAFLALIEPVSMEFGRIVSDTAG